MVSIYPVVCPVDVFAAAFDFLASWHWGQRCPLYSLLSTRKIHNFAHLQNLQRELDATKIECESSEEWQALQRWIDTFPRDYDA